MTTQDWDRIALEHRDAFEFALREAGLPSSEVAEALDVRDGVAYETAKLNDEIKDFWSTTQNRYFATPPEVEELYEKQVSVMNLLRNWVSGRRFRVDGTETSEVRIQIFVLSAARVPGCTATFATEEKSETGMSWDVTIFGTGLSGSGSLKVTTKATFTAASGEVKVVFVQGSLTVEKVTVLKRGRVVGHGYRIDGSRITPGTQPGVVTLAKSTLLPAGGLVATYPLASDTRGAIETYKYSDTVTGKVAFQLGIKAFGADVKLKGELKRDRSAELTFQLAGGHDYELRQFADGDGLVWGTTTRSLGSRRQAHRDTGRQSGSVK
jgi:hypothetical protein